MEPMVQDVLSWPWQIMAPEMVIVGTVIVLSLLELFLPKKADRRILAVLGLVGIAAAIWLVSLHIGEAPQQIMQDMYRVDGFANIFKLIALAGTGLVFLLSLQTVEEKEVPYGGEYSILLLTALLGAMTMASSADLLTLFIGLELLSLSSYVLVGVRKRRLQGNEAAFKYVVNGGIASGITLFGMSYLYGLTGTTNLYEIQSGLQGLFNGGFALIITAAFFLVFVGLSFKIAAAPFHMWAPDVYQGAPTPITAFLSTVSKAAGFAIILRTLLIAFAGISDQYTLIPTYFIQKISVFLAVIAAVTMIAGNTLALRQTNVKRMMAYSSIAQAGYLLVPLASAAVPILLDEMIFYLVAYLLMNLGAFAIIAAVIRDRQSEDLRAFAGLYHRAPFTAIAMTIFLLSLAGIPVTSGFFGKFFIFVGAVSTGSYWLAGIMVVASIISYYYYFGIIRQMYMRAGETEAPLKLPASLGLVAIIGLVVTLGAGFFPNLLLDFIREGFASEQFFQLFVQAKP